MNFLIFERKKARFAKCILADQKVGIWGRPFWALGSATHKFLILLRQRTFSLPVSSPGRCDFICGQIISLYSPDTQAWLLGASQTSKMLSKNGRKIGINGLIRDFDNYDLRETFFVELQKNVEDVNCCFSDASFQVASWNSFEWLCLFFELINR